MLRHPQLCDRDAPRDAWPLLLHDALHGGGDLAPCEHGELLPDGGHRRDASPLQGDAWRRVRGAPLLCDGVLLLPSTWIFLLAGDLWAHVKLRSRD